MRFANQMFFKPFSETPFHEIKTAKEFFQTPFYERRIGLWLSCIQAGAFFDFFLCMAGHSEDVRVLVFQLCGLG